MASNMGDDRFAPPQAHVADVALPSDGLVLASRGRRLAGAMLDVAIALFLGWLIYKLSPWNPLNSSMGSFWDINSSNLWGILVFLVAHGYLLASRGQTIGKALLQMRIVRPDGSPASLVRLLGLRYGIGYLINFVPAISIVYALIDSLLIFRSSKRCLHDDIADTVVIKL
jgi:uncharacterized RDD family membrane protein YckC